MNLGLSHWLFDCLGELESFHVAVYEIRRTPFLPHRNIEGVKLI